MFKLYKSLQMKQLPCIYYYVLGYHLKTIITMALLKCKLFNAK